MMIGRWYFAVASIGADSDSRISGNPETSGLLQPNFRTGVAYIVPEAFSIENFSVRELVIELNPMESFGYQNRKSLA
jgi:hypothetical protein